MQVGTITTRTFNLTITYGDDQEIEFSMIDAKEYEPISQYMTRQKGGWAVASNGKMADERVLEQEAKEAEEQEEEDGDAQVLENLVENDGEEDEDFKGSESGSSVIHNGFIIVC